MPYNVDKDQGGDNKENTGWMEDCVEKVMGQGKDKSSAIAICKATLKKKKAAASELELLEESRYKEKFIREKMLEGYTFAQAEAMYPNHLEKINFIYNSILF